MIRLEEKYEQVVQFRKRGFTYSEISKIVSVSKSTVSVWLAKKAFSIQRVKLVDLNFKSPYNTYLNDGLPPGPISIASIESIDAVLKAPDHDYIFFCAKPGYTGQHNFAATLSHSLLFSFSR